MPAPSSAVAAIFAVALLVPMSLALLGLLYFLGPIVAEAFRRKSH